MSINLYVLIPISKGCHSLFYLLRHEVEGKKEQNAYKMPTCTLQFHLTGFKPLPLSLKAQLSLLVCIKVLTIAVAKVRTVRLLDPWSLNLRMLVCQGSQKSEAESSLRRIGHTPCCNRVGSTEQEQPRVNKDSRKEMSLRHYCNQNCFLDVFGICL